MSENRNQRINEAMRATRGLRIEGRPPEQSTLSRVVNEYIRDEAAKAKTVLPLDHEVFTNKDRPRQ